MLRWLMIGIFAWGLLGFPPVAMARTEKTGTVVETDGQGRLKSRLTYKKDKLVRKRIYEDNGQLVLDTLYRDGKPIVIKTFYMNGNRKSVWTQKSGEAKFFYPTGKHKVTVQMNKPMKTEP